MSYRFARRPLWLLSHAFVLFCVVGFVGLGLWQLQRHDQRAERNATVGARADLPTVPAAQALDEVADADELRFRTLAAEGTYGDEVLIVDNRSLGGLPGAWVLAPLELDDGSTVVVNRGFQFNDEGAVSPPPPPDGEVRLEGTVATWQGECGVRRTDDGRPAGTACLNQEAAEEAFGTEVAPIVLQRQVAEPAEADVLEPVPAPELDAGPHRSYAVQWFTFAALAAVVYALILRRQARTTADDVTDVTSVSRRP